MFDQYFNSSKLGTGDNVKYQLLCFREILDIRRKTCEDLTHHVKESINSMYLDNDDKDALYILSRCMNTIDNQLSQGMKEIQAALVKMDDFIKKNYPE